MMQYKGYVGNVEFDAEAGILHGEVLGLRDVVTFQGRSIDEIERAFRESVDDYLDFCHSRGESPEKPRSGTFMVRLGSDLHRRLDMVARREGKSLNSVVKEFLEREANAAMPSNVSPSPASKSRRGGKSLAKTLRRIA